MSASNNEPARLSGDRPAAATAEVLSDRRELAFIAVERTRMPMVITDPRQPDNPIVLANSAFLNETGFASDEVIGRNCRFLQGPETASRSIDEIRRAVSDGRELTIELLNYRKDGTSFWNELYLSPIHDDDGRLIYFFASQLDVSERRRMHDLAAAEHLMLREIEHRAKNALALVQGIVRLSQAETVDEFSNRVQGRVDALAKAHTVLAEGRWNDVPLERLIRAHLEPFSIERFELDGPLTNVAAALVQPLALVLHEVIANAAHHGALSMPGGTVSIHWHPEDGVTHIELHEVGGPPPASERVPGFGMRIIDSIVRRQLRGSIAFNWHPVGLQSVLRLPSTVIH